MKESEKSVFFFSPAVLIITVVLCTLLLQTFCSVLLNFADQNHSRCGLSRRGLRIKGLLVIERSSTMRALEKLGLLRIKKVWIYHCCGIFFVPLMRHLVHNVILAMVIIWATCLYFRMLSRIFDHIIETSNLTSVLMKIFHKHHLFSSC